MKVEETSDVSFARGAEDGERAMSWRGPRDAVALAIASCGVGFIPLAPGTWGSALGVALYFAVQASEVAYGAKVARVILVSLIIVLAFVGRWAATQTEAILKRKDPGPVVIDEVVGQLVVFLFAARAVDWRMALAGFILFRLFDTWKPYPIRRVERLASGTGIMADDLIAGLYAGAALWALPFWHLW